jgi:4-alpha-glucanotransferase
MRNWLIWPLASGSDFALVALPPFHRACGFGNVGAHGNLPHRLKPNCVVYTGTHDNDTTLGWFQSGATEQEKQAALAYVGESQDGINWALIRAGQDSWANFCIFPVQDVIGLGSEARMNMPSKSNGNFRWRMKAGALTPAFAEKLAALAEVSDRLPQAVAVPTDEDFAA